MKRRTWLAAGAAAAGLGYWAYRRFLEPATQRWGATDAEARARLPGDRLIPDADTQSTLAVTVQAKPAHIWPWLVQMGTGRAGWYSYDALDNRGQASAVRILPEHQDLAIGDTLPASPDEVTGFHVARLDPERALVMQDIVDTRTGEVQTMPGGPSTFTWALVLEPVDEERTRLLARIRARSGEPDRATWLVDTLFPLAHLIMQRKQLLEIKKRAEILAHAHLDRPPTPAEVGAPDQTTTLEPARA